MNAKEILIAAKAKIATPETWTQGTFARDARGGVTYEADPAAVCWCSLGALSLVSQNASGKLYLRAHGELYQSFEAAGFQSISKGNDWLSHPEVMACWDKAIASAE